MSLEAAVLQAKKGDPQAFERLWATVEPTVVRWVGAQVRDPDAAEDVVQAVLIQMWRRLVTFRGTGRFTTWLYSVTHNQVRMARRAEARHWRKRIDVCLDELATASPEGRYLDGIETKRMLVTIRARVPMLPVAQKRAFIAVDLAQRTPSEAARSLDMSPGVVRSNVCRARERLREELSSNELVNRS